MAVIGPNAKLRVDGREEHDVGTLTFELGGENTPFTPLGKDAPDRYTNGIITISWTAEIEIRPDGTYAIDWEGWKTRKEDKTLVVTMGARTERLLGCVIDSIGNNLTRADGKWMCSVKGKALRHSFV